MKNCFNQILICLNITDSLHIGFAILDGIRNNFESSYPTFLMRIFPYFHYPFYRYSPFSLQQFSYHPFYKIYSFILNVSIKVMIEVLQNSPIGTFVQTDQNGGNDCKRFSHSFWKYCKT